MPTTPPGLNNVMACMRAVLFNNDHPVFYTSMTGTGFFLAFYDELFFVTARHVVEGFEVEQIAVQYHLEKPELVPFAQSYTYNSVDSDDTDQVDILILRADKKRLKPELFQEFRPFLITHPRRILKNYQSGMWLSFSGCPTEKFDIRYEERKATVNHVTAHAHYVAPTSSLEIHEMKAIIPDDFPDMDGLSGSPVFYMRDIHTVGAPAQFAGMMIRATNSSKLIRFISADRIVSGYLFCAYIDNLKVTEPDVWLQYFSHLSPQRA